MEWSLKAMREIAKLVLVLGLICGISAGSLATVRTYLSDRIEKQNDLFVRGPALELLLQQPALAILGNKLILDTPDGPVTLFYKLDSGQASGLAIETNGKGGYGGDISIMLGVDMVSDKLLGLEIIKHQETPGVGSQIEKGVFRNQWLNLSANDPVCLKTDGGTIDGISGATYSTNAVINGSQEALSIFNNSKDRIRELISQMDSADQNPLSN